MIPIIPHRDHDDNKYYQKGWLVFRLIIVLLSTTVES